MLEYLIRAAATPDRFEYNMAADRPQIAADLLDFADLELRGRIGSSSWKPPSLVVDGRLLCARFLLSQVLPDCEEPVSDIAIPAWYIAEISADAPARRGGRPVAEKDRPLFLRALRLAVAAGDRKDWGADYRNRIRQQIDGHIGDYERNDESGDLVIAPDLKRMPEGYDISMQCPSWLLPHAKMLHQEFEAATADA